MSKFKVISGGQTGVDKIGLMVARILGIKTGGTAPKGWRTEDGPDLSLEGFGLVESSSRSYALRTSKNIKDADFTVVFGDVNSAGSLFTIRECKDQGKPCVTNPDALTLARLLRSKNVQVLNVAGNRGSKLSDAQWHDIHDTLYTALRLYQDSL